MAALASASAPNTEAGTALTTPTTTTTTTTRCLCSRVPLFACHFSMDTCEQPVSGAAQRRKPRRLRSWWRHEQQSIAAALATCTTPHEDRGRPGPERRRARRSTRPSSERLLLPSLPAWQSRRGRRNGFHSAPWSPCSRRSCPSRLSMFLCNRRLTSRWISCRFLTTRCPSRLLTCPRSLWTPPRSARCSLSRSWREQLVEVPVPVPSFDDWVRWEETYRATGFTWLGGFDVVSDPFEGSHRQPRAVK